MGTAKDNLDHSKTINPKSGGLKRRTLRTRALPWVTGAGATLLLAAANAYPGDFFVYLLFSCAFLLLFASAFYQPRTYSYSFLAIFLWIGFWLKVSWHLAWGTGFPEPTGQFIGSPAQWDYALIVSTVGAL